MRTGSRYGAVPGIRQNQPCLDFCRHFIGRPCQGSPPEIHFISSGLCVCCSDGSHQKPTDEIPVGSSWTYLHTSPIGVGAPARPVFPNLFTLVAQLWECTEYPNGSARGAMNQCAAGEFDGCLYKSELNAMERLTKGKPPRGRERLTN